jgi:hypothetical protein
MSAHVVMVNADTYIGIVAAHAREVTTEQIKENDTRRLIWTKLILPIVMKKDFIDRVVTSKENFVMFTVDVNAPNSPLLPNDLLYLDTDGLSSHNNTAYYQNFSQIADNNIPIGMTPWQIRFDFAKPVHNILLAFLPSLVDEITDIFKANGWKFWLSQTGFTIAPYNLYNNLKSASDAYLTWMNLRDEPLHNVSPQFVGIETMPDPPPIVRVG